MPDLSLQIPFTTKNLVDLQLTILQYKIETKF